MLKLFRDYVFHQVTEDGRPWLDMAHVIQCLNKLDAGVQEKVYLIPDKQKLLFNYIFFTSFTLITFYQVYFISQGLVDGTALLNTCSILI